MTELAPSEADAGHRPGAQDWHVREAGEADVPAVAAAVAELLVELSGGGPPAVDASTSWISRK